MVGDELLYFACVKIFSQTGAQFLGSSITIRCAKCQIFGIWHTKHQKPMLIRYFKCQKFWHIGTVPSQIWDGTDRNCINFNSFLFSFLSPLSSLFLFSSLSHLFSLTGSLSLTFVPLTDSSESLSPSKAAVADLAQPPSISLSYAPSCRSHSRFHLLQSRSISP